MADGSVNVPSAGWPRPGCATALRPVVAYESGLARPGQ